MRKRNIERGDSYSMDVSDHVFEAASDKWQPIDELECIGCELVYIDTQG